MSNGKCSKCKIVLSVENSSPSVLQKGAGYCRACVKDTALKFIENSSRLLSTVQTDGLCNKALNTLSGGERGFCAGKINHIGKHGNFLCTKCGKQTRKSRHAWCRDCQELDRRNRGVSPPIRQVPGKVWVFSCGCQGVLPPEGESNKFARWDGSPKYGVFAHYCRIARIISASMKGAKRRRSGYKSVDQNIPHSVIYNLMEEKSCWRCRQPLVWEFGLGKTPHLHHDHKTGEIFGFTHPECNPKALEDEIDELKAEIRVLRNLDYRMGENHGDQPSERIKSV